MSETVFILNGYNAPHKETFLHPQNDNVQFGNEGLPNQQTGIHTQIPPPPLAAKHLHPMQRN